MKKFTDDEIKNFMRKTNEELVLQDPHPVLQNLGIPCKSIGNDSYRMNLRNEKTASAYISLKNGVWKYKDFGSGKNGNIVNIVMDYTGKNFKDSLRYSLETLGVKNYLEEALNTKSRSVSFTAADKKRISRQKEENKQKEKATTLSKVKGVYEVETNQLAIDYLKARGIIKIPPQMKIISGEYENKNGELKKAFGVGILTQNGGADIHFLKKVGDLKTMNFGAKDISFFTNQESKKVAIFESKMDYAAAYQQMPLDGVNIIIANSTSNAKKVSDLLQKEHFESIMFFNQNDRAGYQFVVNVAKEAQIEDFKCLKYDVMSEFGKDANDLLLDGEKLSSRIQDQNINYFKSISNALEEIHKTQNQKPVTIEDIQFAQKSAQQTIQQERR